MCIRDRYMGTEGTSSIYKTQGGDVHDINNTERNPHRNALRPQNNTNNKKSPISLRVVEAEREDRSRSNSMISQGGLTGGDGSTPLKGQGRLFQLVKEAVRQDFKRSFYTPDEKRDLIDLHTSFVRNLKVFKGLGEDFDILHSQIAKDCLVLDTGPATKEMPVETVSVGSSEACGRARAQSVGKKSGATSPGVNSKGLQFELMDHLTSLLKDRDVKNKFTFKDMQAFLSSYLSFCRNMVSVFLRQDNIENAVMVELLAKVVAVNMEDMYVSYVLQRELFKKQTEEKVGKEMETTKIELAEARKMVDIIGGQHAKDMNTLKKRLNQVLQEKCELERQLDVYKQDKELDAKLL
eukprot:TRINITY_DN1880_c0_g1_i1.p1 TRINITY_DN1880_c0_g1~~TRINITY_DN1880_c0_g1_i1.p1  ORF type:complete len:371 (+),score=100.10 TRINITY_DN1880_c0_g1_i1:61-1113(+)